MDIADEASQHFLQALVQGVKLHEGVLLDRSVVEVTLGKFNSSVQRPRKKCDSYLSNWFHHPLIYALFSERYLTVELLCTLVPERLALIKNLLYPYNIFIVSPKLTYSLCESCLERLGTVNEDSPVIFELISSVKPGAVTFN